MKRAQFEEHAGKLLGVFGATFAFLVGFAITITWSAVGAGQDAVDLQASSAQQLSWATSEIQDQAGAAEVNGNLRNYLNTVVKQGWTTACGWRFHCAALCRNIRHAAEQCAQSGVRAWNTDPMASGMVSAAASLTAAQKQGNCGSAAIASDNPDCAHRLVRITAGGHGRHVCPDGETALPHVCMGVPLGNVCRRGVDDGLPVQRWSHGQPRTAECCC